jgi:hypothetical protein
VLARRHAQNRQFNEIVEQPKGFRLIWKSRGSLHPVPVWHFHDSLPDRRPASSLRRILETFQPQAHLTVCTRVEDDC